jgi:hypothetical protein
MQYQLAPKGGQGAALSPGAMSANAEGTALRARYHYYPNQKSESTLRDERLRAFFAKHGLNVMSQGPLGAVKGVSGGITNLAISANEAFKEAVIPGYQSPATKQAKALRARYKKGGGTGTYKPTPTGYVPMPGSEQYQRPTEANPYMANPYAYRSYLDYLRRVYMPSTTETTAAPTPTPEYPSGGYGGYGYGGGWGGYGGGGGVNINFGNGGRTQQRIAPLYATPSPDIPGWLQSLISWNIGS